MKPPNIATPPPDQQHQATLAGPPMQQLQQTPTPLPPATTVTSTITSTITTTQTPQQSVAQIPTKSNQQQPPPITQTPQPSSTTDNTSTTTGQQQAPLALTTQPQSTQVGAQMQAAAPMTIAPQSTQPIVLAISPLSATVPNHNVIVTTAQITLATQSTPIQLQAPITTHMSNITPGTNLTTIPNVASATTAVAPVPLNAHQQSTATIVQSTLTNHPPTTLPIVPISTTTPVKSEPTKYICCLLDNGIRCDRIAGNASFSARIQKIVGTKKMNFALDPTVRHAYICEHHKAIITVAKKSTALARDTKASARNYTANSNSNTLASQASTNYNDLSMRQQQVLQHPMNLELMNNQTRLANNHAGPMNSINMRQGPQVAYGHYPGVHLNQVGSMDIMMGGMDCTGGDSVASSSGGVDVDLQQLQVNTLRRYKRHFRVQTRPGLNKMQLAESLKSHFRTLPIIEKEAITYFVYIVKCYRNKLDHNPKAD